MQKLIWPELDHLGLHLYCHRNDLISATYSGNKFYKLFFNIKEALIEGKTHLLSFGGAYSNHLYALAALGAELGIKTIGVIRGHKPADLSPTLVDAQQWGMDLCFINKKAYAKKDLNALPVTVQSLINTGAVAIIPEGGSNLAGAKGAVYLGKAIAAHFSHHPYYVCTAAATGTTLVGLTAGSSAKSHTLAISVLKGEDMITPEVLRISKNLGDDAGNFTVNTQHHCGGYAKITQSLLNFIKRFEAHNAIPIEPVYTGKMLFALEKLALDGYWAKGSHIVAVHTGGLQGRRGFKSLL